MIRVSEHSICVLGRICRAYGLRYGWVSTVFVYWGEYVGPMDYDTGEWAKYLCIGGGYVGPMGYDTGEWAPYLCIGFQTRELHCWYTLYMHNITREQNYSNFTKTRFSKKNLNFRKVLFNFFKNTSYLLSAKIIKSGEQLYNFNPLHIEII